MSRAQLSIVTFYPLFIASNINNKTSLYEKRTPEHISALELPKITETMSTSSFSLTHVLSDNTVGQEL